MAPKSTLRLSARSRDASTATESHAERMARRSVQKATESLPEMDRLLAQTLPKALNEFATSYRGLRKKEDLLQAAPALEPARTLRQVVWHFRDLSWRTALRAEQASSLSEAFAEPLKIVQVLVTLIAGLDLQTLLRRASSSVLAGILLLGLEVSGLYCVLASSFGVPATLVVEEVTLGILKGLKEVVRQIITPLQSPEAERSKKGPSDGSGQGGDLRFSAEEASSLCASSAELMQAVHEFLSRHRLAEDQLHQLIHMALSIFFLGEPNFRLCAAAEEVLVTIFSRHEALRGSIVQEFLSRAPRLPAGKRAKKFQIPATEESGAYGLSTWTHLLLRLCQSTCLPLREPIGSNVDFDAIVEQRPAAQSVVVQLISGLLQRLVLSRSKDEEARAILEDFADEVLSAAFKPMWPGAMALLRQLLQQLIALLQEKKQAGDITVREFALKLLSRAEVRLWHHATQSSQGRVVLPEWTQPPEEVPKEGRLLQHIALRVSLEDGRDMPWSHAARVVEAWDAELFLSKGADDAQAEGLTSLSDDIVFLHLAMAFLADECTVPLLLPPTSALESSTMAPPAAPLSAAVFGAAHPVHAWSFLVCDCAEAAQGAPTSEDAPRSRVRGSTTPLQRFLASAWCSPTLVCDTATWRGAGGRRVLLPFTVFKVYRQLRSQELDGLRRAALDCIVMQANSPQASLRKTAMRALSDLVDMDISVLSLRAVEETVDMRLRDESSWVRQVSLDLLGRILEGSLAEGADEAPKLRDGEGAEASARSMLLRFHKTVRGRVNDTAVIVRRQATKILSAFVLNHPDHADVVPVTLDLLRRSTDSDALRNLVLGTFELLWFMDDEPTPEAARQLCRVVDASRSMVASVGDVLQELLRRFRKSIGSRKNSKGYEFAIRRWTTLILNEFVQLKCQQSSGAPPPKKAKGAVKKEPAPAETTEEQWLSRRALLSTLEAFAAAQPKDLLVHLRPLTIYLALEDDSSQDDQWVAIKVCRILSSVLPYVAERRGLMDHRQVQVDLQALIRNQSSSGVHEAVRCLCLAVKFVTGDLAQIVSHLNVAVPALSRLCVSAEQKPGSLERIQLMYMSRQAWVLASIMECLNIDEYVHLEGLSPAEQPKRRLLPRSELKFDFVGGSVASTVVDLLLRLNAIGEPQLRAVAASCMGFFLKGHRGFTKERRVLELLQGALSSSDLLLCRKALETLSALLGHFRTEAERESKAGAADFADSRDGRVAGSQEAKPATSSTTTGSAIEAAQPLAAFADVVLSHITLAGSVGPAAGRQAPIAMKKARNPKRGRSAAQEEVDTEKAESVLRVRIEALSVVQHLHQQGLVNPMAVLPKVFALTFAGDARLSEPATAMLKEMLELRPSLLLNRLDEALREAFLALLSAAAVPVHVGEALSAQQLLGVGDVYVERFRKQKALRDTFLRKALREMQRLQTTRSEERFAELAALGVVGVEDADSSSGNRKGSRGGIGALPLRQQQQILYAQFVASAVTSLPFSFENEPLLLIFECNHHLALHAGALLASGSGSKDKEKEAMSPEQVFTEALSIVSCVVMKSILRKEYNLSPEQCATFNPKDIRQERIKAFPTGGFGRGDKDDGGHSAARNRFPASEWLEKILPLVENFGQPDEIIAYVRTITDEDPWDDSRTRHEAKVDALEGRRQARKAKASPKAATPARGRGRGRGRPTGKASAKKKGRRRGGALESEDDSDYEAPAARKRLRVQEEPAEEGEEGDVQEESDYEPNDVD